MSSHYYIPQTWLQAGYNPPTRNHNKYSVKMDEEVRLGLLDSGHYRMKQPIIVSPSRFNASGSLIDKPPPDLNSFAHALPESGHLQHGIQLVWRNLSYHVNRGSLNPFASNENQSRKLIHNLNGSIRNGQLTAIIGPSGAGKTTLIECLAGRRIRGVTGDLSVKYNGVSKSSIKISYYSQKDSLNELLTVEESLLYASQLRNCLKSGRNKDALFQVERTKDEEHSSKQSYHQVVVEGLVEQLNLRKCLKVRVGQCSGGQKRRLSIALELIFSPTILLLDEPTSGLDSLSSEQCVRMLKDLASTSSRPMVIATSIHQPTATILSLFDQLYIISYNGQCIYNGPTENLVQTLQNFGLNCPAYHNPADYVVEIASGGKGGDGPIDHLAEHFKSVCEEQSNASLDRSISIPKLVQATQRHSIVKQVLTTWVLTKRCMLSTFRDPNIYIARFMTILSTLILLVILYKNHKIGELDGCLRPPSRDMLEKLQTFDFFSTNHTYYANFGFLFYSVILMVFISILPTLLSFPLEVSVFIKENFNGWYSLKSYYLARNLADFPPILCFPILYGTCAYIITHQVFEWWRFAMYNFILVVVAFLAQGVGFLVSAYFVNDVTTSTVVGGILNIPLFLFTGLLIKISIMPKYFQPFTYLSYFRLAFESLLVTIYGIGRCPTVQPLDFQHLKSEFGDNIVDFYMCVHELDPNLTDNITAVMDNYNDKFLSQVQETSSSVALYGFNYDDSILPFNIMAMFLYVIVLRLLAYLVLYRKTTVK